MHCGCSKAETESESQQEAHGRTPIIKLLTCFLRFCLVWGWVLDFFLVWVGVFWFVLGFFSLFLFYSLLWEYSPPRNFSTKLTEQFHVVI